MKKIKIVWLAPFPLDKIKGLVLNNAGKGNGTWLLNLATELRKRGEVDLHIITYTSKIGEDVQVYDDGITFHILNYQIPIVKKGFPYYCRIDVLFWYFPLVIRMIRLIDKLNPDIVHAHGTESCYALVANRYKKCPSIISIQGIISEYVKISPTVYFWLQKRIERNTIIDGVNFGCRTDWDKSFVRSINPSANIIYLPEAIGSCFFENQWNGVGLNTLTFVGSIIERKGVLDLIRVCARIKNQYPNFILNLIGEGPSDYVAKIKTIINKLGLYQNVIWHGSRSSEQIADILKDTTVYVLPTYSDNSPNSLCEAMAAGVPSIAYSTGGVPSLIHHNIDGCLVNVGDVDMLSDTICRILSDSELQRKLSTSARNVGIERNNPISVCEIYMQSYNSLIHKLS